MFWRSKSAKPPAEGPGEPGIGADDGGDSAAPSSDDTASTNVVPLVGQKLSDRLADRLGDREPNDGVTGSEISVSVSQVRPSGQRGHGPSPSAKSHSGLLDIQKAVYSAKPGRHIIALGQPGSGRRDAARRLAEVRAQALEAAPDWIYVLDPDNPSRLLAFSVPHGEAARFVRDATAALAKSAAMFERMMSSDAYRLSLDLIDEDMRYRADKLLEGVRRRADNQNIAVIKSLDGYVLAPMHDGKVVRADVFRALPDGLRRDVEAKIKDLEKDLQAIVAALPEAEVEADDKLTALIEQTAVRAVKPNLAAIRKAYASSTDFAAVFERLEQVFVRQASAAARRPGSTAVSSIVCWTAAGLAPGEGNGDGAPVVLLRSAAPEDLCGEIGRDAAGTLALRPGDLMRANGGIVIAEAWRLVAEPRGWAVLSSILERGAISPRSGPGIAVTAQPIPLSITLILIADPGSLEKLQVIDPGCGQYFAVLSAFDGALGDGKREEAAL